MNGQLCMRTEEGNIYRRHYNDAIMGAIASQITSLTIVYWIVNSDADQKKYQSSASLAFVRRIHREPVNSSHKWPVTRKMFPFDDVIMDIPQITWYNRNDIIAWKGQRPLKYKNLTHTPGMTKMFVISHTMFSSSFFVNWTFCILIQFHWSLFLGIQLKITQFWFR